MQQVAKKLGKSFTDNKSHLFLLHTVKEELMTNIHQYMGVCCFGRDSQLSKYHSLSYHLVPLKPSPCTAHPQGGIKTPLSFPSHISPLSFNITKVDELPVSNLAPP